MGALAARPLRGDSDAARHFRRDAAEASGDLAEGARIWWIYDKRYTHHKMPDIAGTD